MVIVLQNSCFTQKRYIFDNHIPAPFSNLTFFVNTKYVETLLKNQVLNPKVLVHVDVGSLFGHHCACWRPDSTRFQAISQFWKSLTNHLVCDKTSFSQQTIYHSIFFHLDVKKYTMWLWGSCMISSNDPEVTLKDMDKSAYTKLIKHSYGWTVNITLRVYCWWWLLHVWKISLNKK